MKPWSFKMILVFVVLLALTHIVILGTTLYAAERFFIG